VNGRRKWYRAAPTAEVCCVPTARVTVWDLNPEHAGRVAQSITDEVGRALAGCGRCRRTEAVREVVARPSRTSAGSTCLVSGAGDIKKTEFPRRRRDDWGPDDRGPTSRARQPRAVPSSRHELTGLRRDVCGPSMGRQITGQRPTTSTTGAPRRAARPSSALARDRAGPIS